MEKTIVAIVTAWMISFICFGQETKTILFNSGIVYQSTYENRFSSNFRSGMGFQIGLGYEKTKNNSVSSFMVQYVQTKQGSSLSTYSINYQPTLKYQYQRKVNSLQGLNVGAYIDASTIVSGRIGSWSRNNGVSYSQWGSIGLAGSYLRKSGNKILDISLALPFIGYVTRPSYGSTFPDEFLKQENFNIYEEGVVGSGFKSGRIRSVNKFGNLDFRTTLYLPFKNSRWHWGIEYFLKILYISDLKPLHQFSNGLGITLKRI